MPAGNRRDAFIFQTLITPTDPATGELAVESEANWQDYFTCFGHIIVKGTRDFVRAGIADADVSHIIQVPRSTETDAIDSTFRVYFVDREKYLHVMDAYRKDQASREIEILCRS